MKTNSIDEDYFVTIFKERFLEFEDNYPKSKYLIRTYGAKNLIKRGQRIDVYFFDTQKNEFDKIEEINDKCEFVKNYFEITNYECIFLRGVFRMPIKNSSGRWTTRGSGNYFFGYYMKCRFIC